MDKSNVIRDIPPLTKAQAIDILRPILIKMLVEVLEVTVNTNADGEISLVSRNNENEEHVIGLESVKFFLTSMKLRLSHDKGDILSLSTNQYKLEGKSVNEIVADYITKIPLIWKDYSELYKGGLPSKGFFYLAGNDDKFTVSLTIDFEYLVNWEDKNEQ